jgi:Zn finger protein HypA/HybF involved in hydrogenase expression
MNTKNVKKNSDQVKEEKKIILRPFNVKIQCPDCGSIFVLNQYGEIFCIKCERVFFEDEIRNRCGL